TLVSTCPECGKPSAEVSVTPLMPPPPPPPLVSPPPPAAATPQPPPRSEPLAPPRMPGYEMIEELGRGGMGVVYKARQIALNRMVALKMILPDQAAGPEVRARFRTEGEAVARLQHPNIIQIHEVGESDGRPYFSLEFVGGGG